MDKLIVQVLATREGGAVERGHGTPHLNTYSVGAHSYGAVSLLLLLHPNPSLPLIKALQWHDVAERWLGDMPSFGKSDNPELKAVYEKAENDILRTLGLSQDLLREEQEWLKALDVLDCWFWSREQLRLGNKNILPWIRASEEWLGVAILSGTIPKLVESFFRQMKELPESVRLSDRFLYVAADMKSGPRQTPA